MSYSFQSGHGIHPEKKKIITITIKCPGLSYLKLSFPLIQPTHLKRFSLTLFSVGASYPNILVSPSTAIPALYGYFIFLEYSRLVALFQSV